MGTYFNPSNEGFRKSAKDEIYIDKSGLLNILNRNSFDSLLLKIECRN